MLAWIHRREAAQIAAELDARIETWPPKSSGPYLLRLSDPVMLRVTAELSQPYKGPGAAVLQTCYDKPTATKLVSAAGFDCPAATGARLIAKPRRGSDSIGVRIVNRAPADDDVMVQELVIGRELTVAVLGDTVGMPLELDLPPGVPYSFRHKYLTRPRRAPLADSVLAARVRETAAGIARLLGVDWAARLDFIHARDGRLCFLECDVAPIVARGSAFAESLFAAGMRREEQLRRLTS